MNIGSSHLDNDLNNNSKHCDFQNEMGFVVIASDQLSFEGNKASTNPMPKIATSKGLFSVTSITILKSIPVKMDLYMTTASLMLNARNGTHNNATQEKVNAQ
jgi:hypothetical protein